MEEFEKYIHENRDALDRIEKPPVEAIWKGVQSELQPAKKRNIPWGWAVAAALAIVMLVGWWSRGQQEDTPFRVYDQELARTERAFQQEIEAKMASLDFSKLDQNEYGELLDQLEELDVMHAQIEKDFRDHPQKEQMARTLIRYYELKIKILERISNAIEKSTNHEKRI